jgi:hypothetical protein
MRRQIGNKVATLATSQYRAIDGRISITHTKTGAYTTISVREAKKKLSEVVEDYKAIEKRHNFVADKIRKFHEDMKAVIYEAEIQGPPEEQDILAERVRRRKVQSRVESNPLGSGFKVSSSGLILPNN